MKLVVFLTLISVLQATADSYAQTVALNVRNVPLPQVMKHIQQQSGYLFFLKGEELAKMRVNANIQRTTLEEAMDILAGDLGLEWVIKGKTIILRPTSPQTPNKQHIATELGESQDRIVSGTVTDEAGNPLEGVTVLLKGTKIATITNSMGNYRLSIVDRENTLLFTMVGFDPVEYKVDAHNIINVSLRTAVSDLDEVVVVGFGTQRKELVTGAISQVTTQEIEMVRSPTVGGMLAGKIPGVSFRQPDGRPNSSPMIEVRNMGPALFVIDGIQQDFGAFNNLSPNDIESITVLKDASAAVYGVRAANGVVLVKTKRGKLNEQNSINVETYYGLQNWTRFPQTVNAHEWMTAKLEADMNAINPGTDISPEELEKWRQGTEQGYRSFDWYDFIVKGNAPQRSLNINMTGGSEHINYYTSITQLDQDAVFDKGEFNFSRTNLQSNVESTIANGLKAGIQVNGRIEKDNKPGMFGGDKYWLPRFALFRNRPIERPYANDNPLYINHLDNIETNWAMLNRETLGYWDSENKVIQTNLDLSWETPVKGLTLLGKYSYYFSENTINGHEYPYKVYTYFPESDEYVQTAGSNNTYRAREIFKIFNTVTQLQADYQRTFGTDHQFGATLASESIDRRFQRYFQHATPKTKLPLLQWADMDGQGFADEDNPEARMGFIGRMNYAYKDKYFAEFAGRYDGSWKFAPSKRWGFFPSGSVGWRPLQENFLSQVNRTIFTDLKLRVSYGQLGDDDVGLGAFDYLPGYNFGVSSVILDGELIQGSRNRGEPVTNISWFTVTTANVGIDYTLFDGKLSGSADYFHRVRNGLRGRKWDIILPVELGYSLPEENVNSDAISGVDGSISYKASAGDLNYRIGGNFLIARSKFLHSYKPRWGNSWDHYRNSAEDRYNGIFWGYQVVGQFKHQEDIDNHPVNIDGQGNKTLLPGDFIYKDINRDGRIDDYDVRPIGFPWRVPPIFSYGINLGLSYRSFDFSADLSGASGYSVSLQWEARYPFQNGGTLPRYMYDDRWHRTDPYDVNSEWIPGSFPAIRYNPGAHSNYSRNSDQWLVNVNYLRLRTIEIGYTFNERLLKPIKIQRARIFFNAYNLFSFDNLAKYGLDPEIQEENGLAYPQNKLVNVGCKITF